LLELRRDLFDWRSGDDERADEVELDLIEFEGHERASASG
jgi:hypothetical protein